MYAFASGTNVFFLRALSAVGAELNVLVDEIYLFGLCTVCLGSAQDLRNRGVYDPILPVATYNTQYFPGRDIARDIC